MNAAEFSIIYSQWMGCCLPSRWPTSFQCILPVHSDGPASGCIDAPIIQPRSLHLLLVKYMSLEAQLVLANCRYFVGLAFSFCLYQAAFGNQFNQSSFKEEGDCIGQTNVFEFTTHLQGRVLLKNDSRGTLVPFYLYQPVQFCPTVSGVNVFRPWCQSPEFLETSLVSVNPTLAPTQWADFNLFSGLCPVLPGYWLDSMRFKSDPIWLSERPKTICKLLMALAMFPKQCR